jgi:carboxyl-terminal processing protease
MDFTGVIYGGNGLPFNQVRYIVDGSPGELSKFLVGDKIVTVSGEPFVGQANFFKTSGKKLPVVVERDGKGVNLTISPLFKDPFQAYVEGTTKSARIIDSPEGKIGYVHLWAGGQEPRDAFEDLLGSKLAATDGLILDMRDGYGGNSLPDLDYFYRNPVGYPLFTMQDRGGQKNGAKEYYNKPVVALINGGSRSGKELLAYSLKSSGRAQLVGDRTAGYVLGGRLYPIDERCALYLAVANCEIDGVRLEGIGVEPDVLIPNPDYKVDVAKAQFDKAKELLLPLLKKPLPALHSSK